MGYRVRELPNHALGARMLCEEAWHSRAEVEGVSAHHFETNLIKLWVCEGSQVQHSGLKRMAPGAGSGYFGHPQGQKKKYG